MKDYVADTHALFWYLSAHRNLGSMAALAFEEGEDGDAMIHVPFIVLAELFYLNVKLGNPIDFRAKFDELERSAQFLLTPSEPEDVLDFDTDSTVSEMHDRIIVGLVRRLNVPLLTADQNIIEMNWSK